MSTLCWGPGDTWHLYVAGLGGFSKVYRIEKDLNEYELLFTLPGPGPYHFVTCSDSVLTLLDEDGGVLVAFDLEGWGLSSEFWVGPGAPVFDVVLGTEGIWASTDLATSADEGVGHYVYLVDQWLDEENKGKVVIPCPRAIAAEDGATDYIWVVNGCLLGTTKVYRFDEDQLVGALLSP